MKVLIQIAILFMSQKAFPCGGQLKLPKNLDGSPNIEVRFSKKQNHRFSVIFESMGFSQDTEKSSWMVASREKITDKDQVILSQKEYVNPSDSKLMTVVSTNNPEVVNKLIKLIKNLALVQYSESTVRTFNLDYICKFYPEKS